MADPPPPAPAPPVTPFIRRCTAVACLSGILFGYDLGVVSGALPSLSASLQLTDSQAETVVAFLFIGSALGSFIGGDITDRIGRKRSILVCDGIFLIGSLILGLAPSYGVILFGRIVIGIAVAIAAIADDEVHTHAQAYAPARTVTPLPTLTYSHTCTINPRAGILTQATPFPLPQDDKVLKLQSEMDGMLEIGKQNKELVRASAKQSKQLGKMGKLEDKLAAYKSTVAMQEKVS